MGPCFFHHWEGSSPDFRPVSQPAHKAKKTVSLWKSLKSAGSDVQILMSGTKAGKGG